LSLKLAAELNMSWHDLFQRISQQPAQILRQPCLGLNVGAQADLCVFDPEAVWSLQKADMHSMRYNTPFLSWEFKGRVTHTLLNGQRSFA
jgi:dihydroorotase